MNGFKLAFHRTHRNKCHNKPYRQRYSKVFTYTERNTVYLYVYIVLALIGKSVKRKHT